MANSSFEYVKTFESRDCLPLSNWIVVRVDGRGFGKLCKKYEWKKPNDRRAVDLLNSAAVEIVKQFVDIALAYGQSDEYSFIFHENTTLFERRATKLATTIASSITAEYNNLWSTHFPDQPLTRPFPQFDGRCVCYPKFKILKDYLSWRQADCHINNLYNTTFWTMVLRDGITSTEAEQSLKGTLSKDKNEILFSRFGINYNNEPEIYKKGTVLYRANAEDYGMDEHQCPDKLKAKDLSSRTQQDKEKRRKKNASIMIEHVDMISERFWQDRPYILGADSRVAE